MLEHVIFSSTAAKWGGMSNSYFVQFSQNKYTTEFGLLIFVIWYSFYLIAHTATDYSGNGSRVFEFGITLALHVRSCQTYNLNKSQKKKAKAPKIILSIVFYCFLLFYWTQKCVDSIDSIPPSSEAILFPFWVV